VLLQTFPRPCAVSSLWSKLITITRTVMSDVCVCVRAGGKCAISAWGDWSACSVTCGVGQRVRKRHYHNPMVDENMCGQPVMEFENCIGSTWCVTLSYTVIVIDPVWCGSPEKKIGLRYCKKQAILSCLYALYKTSMFFLFVVCLPELVIFCSLCCLLPFWRMKISNNVNTKYFHVTNLKYRII